MRRSELHEKGGNVSCIEVNDQINSCKFVCQPTNLFNRLDRMTALFVILVLFERWTAAYLAPAVNQVKLEL